MRINCPFFFLLCVGLPVLLASTFLSVGLPKAVVVRHQVTRTRSPQLKVTVLSQQYCKADAELDALRLNLGLQFRNIGKDRLILYKGSNRIRRVMISRNLEDAEAKRYEVNSSLTWVDDGRSQEIDDSVPNQSFIILPPEATYEMETSITLFVVRDETKEISGAIRPGEHVLQVEVQTFPQRDYNTSELSRKWKPIGFLCYEPILSDPLTFQVEKIRKLSECQ
ncbi:MAG: hypothetical protein WAV47_03335 [Blastocatellia bacterium]